MSDEEREVNNEKFRQELMRALSNDPISGIYLASDRGINVLQPYQPYIPGRVRLYDPAVHARDLIFFELYKRNPWLRSVIDSIAEEATKLKFRALYDNDDKHEVAVQLRKWFDTIGEDRSLEQLFEVVLKDVLTYGKAFLAFRDDGFGNLFSLYRLDARITNPDIDDSNVLQGYYQDWHGRAEYWKPDQLLYFYIEGPAGPYIPMSPLETLMSDTAMDIAATRFNMSFWRNATNVGMMFAMDDTEERVNRNRDYIIDRFSNPENAWKPMILEGNSDLVRDGTAIIKDISFSNLTEITRLKICAIYNTPESEIGISQDVNKNVKQGNREGWLESTVSPWQGFLCEVLQLHLLRNKLGLGDLPVEILPPARTRFITVEEAEVSASIARRGATFNEIRAVTQHPPVEGGEQLVVFIDGVGYVPLEFPIDVNNVAVWKQNQAPGPEEQPRSEEDDYNEKVAQSTTYSPAGDVVGLPVGEETDENPPWVITKDDIIDAVAYMMQDEEIARYIVDDED